MGWMKPNEIVQIREAGVGGAKYHARLTDSFFLSDKGPMVEAPTPDEAYRRLEKLVRSLRDPRKQAPTKCPWCGGPAKPPGHDGLWSSWTHPVTARGLTCPDCGEFAVSHVAPGSTG